MNGITQASGKPATPTQLYRIRSTKDKPRKRYSKHHNRNTPTKTRQSKSIAKHPLNRYPQSMQHKSIQHLRQPSQQTTNHPKRCQAYFTYTNSTQSISNTVQNTPIFQAIVNQLPKPILSNPMSRLLKQAKRAGMELQTHLQTETIEFGLN